MRAEIHLGNFEHWTIEAEIAEGSAGKVFRARDASGRVGALKVYQVPFRDSADDPGQKLETIDGVSVQALLQLRHPNLAEVLDYGRSQDGRRWVVTRFIDGPSLAEHLRDRKRLPAEDVQRLGVAVARGLGALHAARLVHRDVKPANILLPGTLNLDEARLVDFGFVAERSQVSHTTMAGALIGSPAYMSPEQVQGLGLDHRADLWALGAVLYEASTGVLPFAGASVPAALLKILTETVDLAPVPEDLRAAIAACLTRDLAKRPQSAEALIQLLEQPVMVAAPSLHDDFFEEGEWGPPSMRNAELAPAEPGATPAPRSAKTPLWPVLLLGVSFAIGLATVYVVDDEVDSSRIGHWGVIIATSVTAGLLVWLGTKALLRPHRSAAFERVRAGGRDKSSVTASLAVAVDELARHYHEHPHARLITSSMALVLEDYGRFESPDPEKKLELTLKVLDTVMRLESRAAELALPWYQRYEKPIAVLGALGTTCATWWALGRGVAEAVPQTPGLIRGCPTAPVAGTTRVRLEAADASAVEWSVGNGPATVSVEFRWPEDTGEIAATDSVSVVSARRGDRVERCVIEVAASRKQ